MSVPSWSTYNSTYDVLSVIELTTSTLAKKPSLIFADAVTKVTVVPTPTFVLEPYMSTNPKDVLPIPAALLINLVLIVLIS